MSTIVTRAGKGSPLSNAECDANFTNLNTDKLEINAALGTPASVTLTNATGLPTAGLVDNAVTDAKLRDSAGLSVIGRGANSTGDPADIVAGTNKQVLRREGSDLAFGAVDLSSNQAVTGTLPVNQGGTGITSFGAGVATWLGTPSSANLAAAVTDETGTGALVFANSPTLVTPALGTPASGVVTNLTGTASININGTVGATTPAAGAFTTLNTSGAVVFNEAGANVDFRVEGDTNANLLFVDASADNVGIGTSAPLRTLSVNGIINIQEGLAERFFINWNSAQSRTEIATAGLNSTTFFTNSAERLRITSTGNVGIGTASPDANLTVNGAASFAAGTALLPSIARAGDLNTGFWFPAADTIAASTAGGERLRIDSSGNVGIGTSSPVTKLHISGSTTPNLRFEQTNSSVVHQFQAALGNFYLNIDATNSLGGSGFFVQQAGTSVLALSASGNLGIGTTTPDANLTVNGAASFAAGTALLPSIARAGDLNTGMWFPAADTIAFSEGGAEAMRIDSSGNVGIGTSSPATKLHVNGTTLFGSGTWPTGSVGLSGSRVALLSNTENQILIIANTESTVGADKGGEILMGAKGTTGTQDAAFARIGGYKESAASGDFTSYLRFSTNSSNGSAFERMRLTSEGYLRMASGSGGIQFNGDTAAANALDDYEEGAWTPTITFDGASAGITYNTTFTGATYTKIGNRVFVSGYLLLTNKGSSTGAAAIANLPFTSVSGNTRFLGATVGGSDFTFANQFWAKISPNTNTIDLLETTEAGAISTLTNADFTNGTELYFSAHYTA